MSEHLYLTGCSVLLILFSVMMYVLQHAILRKTGNNYQDKKTKKD
jgi:hypothetical protein